jgi:parvulin-like peptidyl-prolyl isomerase
MNADLQSVTVASVEGADFSLYDLLHTLRLRGTLAQLIVRAVIDKLVVDAARKQSLTITDEELQKAADNFRMRHRLNKAADTERWLSQNQLIAADLEEGLQRDLLRHKLAEQVTPDQIEKYFADNRAQFDRVSLRHLVVEKEEIAQELLTRIQEEEADFAELARQHSVDERTRAKGGEIGTVPRKRLPPQMETTVFAAKSGAVLGPFQVAGRYVLIKVEQLLLGELSENVTASIRRQLFDRWLAEQIGAAKIEIKLNGTG